MGIVNNLCCILKNLLGCGKVSSITARFLGEKRNLCFVSTVAKSFPTVNMSARPAEKATKMIWH